LEALTTSLAAQNVPVRSADIGDVSRRDVVEAEVVKGKDKYLGAILAFSSKILPDAQEEITEAKIPTFRGDIIYQVLEEYSRWVQNEKTAGVKSEMDQLVRPGKIKLMKGFVFRRSDPAIVGVEVLDGVIKPKYPLVNESGRPVGSVVRIQEQGKDVNEAGAGKQVAVSIDKPMVGRQILEGDTLYVQVPPQHARLLSTKYREYLSPRELAVLDEVTRLGSKTIVGA
jgi:translation initiation factor 5B